MTDTRTTDHRRNRRRLDRRAAAVALPLGLLAAAVAAPSSAGASAPDPGAAPTTAGGVPINSEGAELELDGSGYNTGPLEGRLNLFATPDQGTAQATDVVMFNPIGSEGDFGEVRIASEDPQEASIGQPDPQATEEFVLAITIEHLPGAESEGPVVLRTDPVEFTAAEPEADVAQFPPVNQLYSLQEPVALYSQGAAPQDGDPVGELSAFDVIVNQSA